MVATEPAIGAKAAIEQYLTFTLSGQEYGLDIQRVQEIKRWEKATAIPNSPSYVRGVINLRGAIVPLIDLRRRLGLDSIDHDATTVVIVVRVTHGERDRTMGVIVDSVSDVCRFSADQIDEAPSFGTGSDARFVRGLGRWSKTTPRRPRPPSAGSGVPKPLRNSPRYSSGFARRLRLKLAARAPVGTFWTSVLVVRCGGGTNSGLPATVDEQMIVLLDVDALLMFET